MLKIKRLTAIPLIFLMLLAIVGPVLAEEPDEQRLQDIQRQMQQEQNRANKAQRQVNSLSEQLKLIQVDLDAAERDYNVLKAQRTQTEEQLKINTEILGKAERNLANRTEILNKRVRDIYKNGQVSYLDVLLGATDFADFATRVELLRRVLSQDLSLIAKVKADRELIIQKKGELEQNKAAIVEMEKQVAAKKAVIEARRSEQETVLGSAVKERDSAERAYQELLQTSQRIEAMLRRSQSGDRFAAGASGSMIWPASGPITSPFGWRTHPIFGTQRYHTGIDIGADYGDSVLAADGGVVVYADWMGGYGKAVIVDHGNGISTLYAHNSELLVSEGQRVGKGQTVSRIGSTGYSTGPHLHFEVRQNGTPVSPMAYLP